MSHLASRQLARLVRMRATTAAVEHAMFEAARRAPEPRLSARLAADAYRIQTCHRNLRLIVHRPDDDAPWVQVSMPSACMSHWCMLCARNRSRRLRRHIQSILLSIWRRHPAMRASMLTLSSRNRPIAETQAMLTDHLAGTSRYFARKEVARSHYGGLHSIELAVRGDGREIGVHSHHLQLIDDACMMPGRYLDFMRIRTLWAEALRISDYVPVCDIRTVKAGPDGDMHEAMREAVSETAKYCLKPLSLLAPPPRNLFGPTDPDTLFVDPDVVLHVAIAIKGRRLLRMSGLWKSAASQLDDAPSSDPIPTDHHSRRDLPQYQPRNIQ